MRDLAAVPCGSAKGSPCSTLFPVSPPDTALGWCWWPRSSACWGPLPDFYRSIVALALRAGEQPGPSQPLRRPALAHHDALTGLPNRMLLIDRIYQALVHARAAREKVAVFCLDLDRFKTVCQSRCLRVRRPHSPPVWRHRDRDRSS